MKFKLFAVAALCLPVAAVAQTSSTTTTTTATTSETTPVVPHVVHHRVRHHPVRHPVKKVVHKTTTAQPDGTTTTDMTKTTTPQ